jgi:hypothetical protein
LEPAEVRRAGLAIFVVRVEPERRAAPVLSLTLTLITLPRSSVER